MVSKFSSELRAAIRQAASFLSGFARRKLHAQVAIQYCNGSPRKAETVFGFNRRSVARGLQEHELGEPVLKLPERQGRQKIEQRQPVISQIADAVLSENSQTDPKFQTTLAFTRVTGRQLRESLATSLNVAGACWNNTQRVWRDLARSRNGAS